MFGRATITLGIGPHFLVVYVLPFKVNKVVHILVTDHDASRERDWLANCSWTKEER